MRLEPTMKQAVIRRTVRKFAEERLSPAAVEMDATEEFPTEMAREMATLHYFGLEVPEKYGGAGLDTVSYSIVIEEISRSCAAMGLCLVVHNGVAVYPVYKFGNEEQKQNFLVPMAKGEKIGTFCLTEPNAGSDASSLETIAIRDGNGYILNGNKVFVSNGGVSGFNLIFAITSLSDKRKGYSVFIVESEREGLEKGPTEALMGMRGNPVCPIVLNDCRVPEENRLGGEGEGMKIALSTLNGGRLGIASQALGIAQASLDVSLKYAKERYQFGQSISKFGAVQNFLADMETRIQAARLLTYRASHLKDQDLPHVKESAMAKLYASEVAVEATRIGLQIHGGYGLFKDYDVERFYRDQRLLQIGEGTSEILRIVISRAIGC